MADQGRKSLPPVNHHYVPVVAKYHLVLFSVSVSTESTLTHSKCTKESPKRFTPNGTKEESNYLHNSRQISPG
jgi:hypothetical protein